MRGIIHVHSDFSKDALCSVADLADWGRGVGLQFIGLTDHAEDITTANMRELHLLCEKYSDETFVMIPGLEYRCSGDIHILGLGVMEHIPSSDPVSVACKIREAGGLAILAHPSRIGLRCPVELYRKLHGIEIWNETYDGRWVPSWDNLHHLEEARCVNPAIYAFGGVDLHWLDRTPAVVLELSTNGVEHVEVQTVLECLGSGRFAIKGKYICIKTHGMSRSLVHFSVLTLQKVRVAFNRIRNFILRIA